MTLTSGEQVTIYQDPITCTKPEGTAFLIERLKQDTDTEYWRVRFVPDNFKTSRWINKKHH